MDETDSRQASSHNAEHAQSAPPEDSKKAKAASRDSVTATAPRRARDNETEAAPAPTTDAVTHVPEERRNAEATDASETTESAAVQSTEPVGDAEPARDAAKAAASNTPDKPSTGTEQTVEPASRSVPSDTPSENPALSKGPSGAPGAGDVHTADVKQRQQAAIPQPGASASVQTPSGSEASVTAPVADKAAVKTGAEKNNVAHEPARTVTDPKLAALQKLTQPTTTPTETATAGRASEDKTSFTLPVPWPQKTAIQSASAATNGATKPAADLPAEATARAAQAVPASGSNGKNAGPTPVAPEVKGAAAQASQAAMQTLPKIEIEGPAAARPQASSDMAAVFANNRAAGGNGGSNQNVLPSQSETIAAATALNSRIPRSNALGAAPQSNAMSAAGEKTSAQGTANAGQATAAVNVAAATVQPATPNTGTGAGAAPVPGQLPPATAESTLGGRSQGGAGQSSLSETGTTANGSARTAEAPSSSSSSFADTLRTSGTERSAPPSETRQPLPGAAAEQVKVKLVKAAQGGLDKIKIQLNPSELGKVDIRLEFGSDGGVRGVVTVEKPETLHLLQRDARQLEQALQDAGFNTDGESLEFQMRGGNTNERQQNAGAGNGSPSNAGGDLTAEEEQLDTATAGTEQDGVGDDGSLNMVA
ncbi:flagellar hook-length control protein FliK [Nisaea sp.]|uniref:flagellar hook-length control protein FliK n=1 Tax=Nisaea sp. TaxID=2024842 RepID=UPI003B52F383